MRNFILSHEQMNGEIELRYDERDLINAMLINAEIAEDTLWWIVQHYPVNATKLDFYVRSGFKVNEIPLDLSFDAWWKLWPEQKINRARAEKIWNRMSKADKMRAMLVMPAYRRWCNRNSFKNPKSPDSWLFEKRYENDYNKM